MIAKYLWIAGSLPFIVLGTIHLWYTFFTNKFSSGDPGVDEAMKRTTPVLTKQITMWKAWIGFNASHSSGAIYIGVINLILAIRYFAVLQDPVFLLLNIVTVLFYLWLAKKYWFSIPFNGILIAACCFIFSAILILYN
ncbi:MAG: hypothetical protein ABI707_02505 [Ferruginibacter sp.]